MNIQVNSGSGSSEHILFRESCLQMSHTLSDVGQLAKEKLAESKLSDSTPNLKGRKVFLLQSGASSMGIWEKNAFKTDQQIEDELQNRGPGHFIVVESKDGKDCKVLQMMSDKTIRQIPLERQSDRYKISIGLDLLRAVQYVHATMFRGAEILEKLPEQIPELSRAVVEEDLDKNYNPGAMIVRTSQNQPGHVICSLKLGNTPLEVSHTALPISNELIFTEATLDDEDLMVLLNVAGRMEREKAELLNFVQNHDSLKQSAAVDPEKANQINQTLVNYGLTVQESLGISSYFNRYSESLRKLAEPVFIHREPQGTPPLARSLVYIPNGPKQGLYVLLKQHGPVKQIQRGAHNRATLAINFKTGEKMVFRSARAEDVKKGELEAMQQLADDPEHFLTGVLVKYRGSWSPRTSKDSRKPENNVDKVGFIMDYMTGGDLFEYLNNHGNLAPEQRFKITFECAESLAALHSKGWVHLDLKSENLFFRSDGRLLMGDFGAAEHPHAFVEKLPGTPGIIAPEVVQSFLDQMVRSDLRYNANFKADIWSLGCVLADLYGSEWVIRNGQTSGEWKRILNSASLEKVKSVYFPFQKFHAIEKLICACLSFKPEERPSAEQVLDELTKIGKERGFL